MIQINIDNVNGLNESLQVGDAVYAIPTGNQSGAQDLESMDSSGNSISVGIQNLVGILVGIEVDTNNINLIIDDTFAQLSLSPGSFDHFIMFSKYNQKNGDLTGYYAQAKFVNNSKEKAELFAVSSEVVINSK
jgi:hypothetical protein